MNAASLYFDPAMVCTVSVLGDPMPWKRAGSSGKRRYTPQQMKSRQEAWRIQWRREHGLLKLDRGIAVVGAVFEFRRPQTHLAAHGGLSAIGAVSLAPKADLDNLLKLPLDALQGLAFDDDTQIVAFNGLIIKRWTMGEPSSALSFAEVSL